MGRLAPDEEVAVLLVVRTGVFASTNESQTAAGAGNYGIDAWVRVTYLTPVEEDVAAGPVTVTVAPD